MKAKLEEQRNKSLIMRRQHIQPISFFCQTFLSYLYSFVVYLYVNGSGSITSVGVERANLSAVVYL